MRPILTTESTVELIPPPDPPSNPIDPKPPPIDPLSSLGLLTARLWANHIHERYRDATVVNAPSYSPHFPFLDRDITRDFHFHARRALRRGSRCGA
jgi:hypothetical protein